ncbi:hypothetical protein GCM10029964_076120 [Kibdelosporangium lantanae]
MSTTFAKRVAAADWAAVAAEVDDLGCALLPKLVTDKEAAAVTRLYQDVSRFRATVDMKRYRFGEGSTDTSPNPSLR